MSAPYYVARRTPDGPMVTHHDPAELDALVFPSEDYDWGAFNKRTVELAEDLITHVTDGSGHLVQPGTLAAKLLANLPPEGWKLTREELRDWLDKRLFDPDDIPF